MCGTFLRAFGDVWENDLGRFLEENKMGANLDKPKKTVRTYENKLWEGS